MTLVIIIKVEKGYAVTDKKCSLRPAVYTLYLCPKREREMYGATL